MKKIKNKAKQKRRKSRLSDFGSQADRNTGRWADM
jgi:hypothetical protein